MYSGEIIHYATIKTGNIIIPDDVLIQDGVSCGDSIVIHAAINNERLFIKFNCEACILCRALAGYIYHRYNQKSIVYVLQYLKKEVLYAKEDYDSFCLSVFKQDKLRKECILRPLEMIYDFIKKISDEKIEEYKSVNTNDNLDCDACVSTGRIAWNKDRSIVNNKSYIQHKDTSDLSTNFRRKWMVLGKIYLSKSEIKSLNSTISNATSDDIYMIRQLKIDQMIYHHMKKNNIPYEAHETWKSVIYRQNRFSMLKPEINNIFEYIKNNNIRAYCVKGSYMKDFYDKNIGIRIFLDYDIVAESADDAFRIATYLFKRKYKIFFSEFSIKKIEEKKANSYYTGHFHLQKLIYGKYKIIIDINFPGFPMGRVAVYTPYNIDNNVISREDHFVITLCHLFKHKDVFMKDINDLYLLLKNGINAQILSDYIKQNKLQFFFLVAIKYIENNYDLNQEIFNELYSYIDEDSVDIGNWPYDYADVYRIKRHDWTMRTQKFADNDRIYLFPLIVFNKYVNLEKFMFSEYFLQYKIECIQDNMYFIKYNDARLLLCGMGIFWDNENSVDRISREKMEIVIYDIVKQIKMDNSIVEIPYYLKRIDEWFF